MEENNQIATAEQGSELQILNQKDMPKTIISETAGPLSAILMENIKKVQADPNYINQAKEIRDNVREIINLGRVEIDMFREVRKVTGSKLVQAGK